MRPSPLVQVVLVALALVTGLGTLRASDPNPTRSEYFESVAGGFIIKRKHNTLQMEIGLKPLKPLQPNAFLSASFQNPANAAQSIVVDKSAKEARDKRGGGLTIESPPVTGMRDNSLYLISVRLYTDKSKKVLFGTHDQRVAYHQNVVDYARKKMGLSNPH